MNADKHRCRGASRSAPTDPPEAPKIKALSIRQPWAEAILSGYKEFEFRTWPTKYRGPLLIHAPKIFDNDGFIHLVRYGCYSIPQRKKEYFRGAILGSCLLTECFRVSSDQVCFDLVSIGARPGFYAWKLENISRIDPIPCPGRLSLWTPPGEILTVLEKKIATDEHR